MRKKPREKKEGEMRETRTAFREWRHTTFLAWGREKKSEKLKEKSSRGGGGDAPRGKVTGKGVGNDSNSLSPAARPSCEGRRKPLGKTGQERGKKREKGIRA